MLSLAGWRAEWLIVRRHPLIWVVVLGSIALIALATSNEGPRNDRELFEAVVRLGLLVPAFLLPFIVGAIAPIFYLREVEHGMSDLLAAYPQTARRWLAARAGSFVLLLAGLGALAYLVIAATLAISHPDQLGELMLRAGTLLILSYLPACLIWACVLARVSCATGKASMVHLAAAFGWLAYHGLATLTGTPLIAGSFVVWEPLRTAMILADPYAITALTSPSASGSFAGSRELILAAGRAGWLGLCYWLVSGIAAVPALLSAEESVAIAPGRFAWLRLRSSRDRELPSYFALLVRWTVIDKFFLLALICWAVLIFPEVYSGMQFAEQFSLLTPDSRDALNRVMWDMVAPMGALLLLYAADRASRMSSIAGMEGLSAATPHASWRFLLAQLGCLCVVALGILAYTLTIVCVAQLAAQSPVQPREYLEQGGQAAPGLLLTATAFVALHGLIRSRMAANLAGLMLLVLGHSSLAPAMGLLHPLWKPLSMPLEMPDHVLGLSGNWAVLLTYVNFWAAVCCAAMLVAARVYHRGLPYRQLSLRRALQHPAALAAALLLAGGAWQGLALHRMLASDLALETADDQAERRAAYERRYAQWLGRPQPDVAAVQSQIDFGRDGRSADLHVTMELVNRTAVSINRILIGRNLMAVHGQVAIDGARAEQRDDLTDQTVFRLASAMGPGDRRTLRFSTWVARSALASSESLLILRPEFAALPAYQIFPVIGYRREFSLRDPVRRTQMGLATLTVVPPSQLVTAGHDASLARHQATFDTVISVGRGRHAIAPGELVRNWSAGERSYFHFRTDQPIRNAPAFFALPWSARHWSAELPMIELYAPGVIATDDPNLVGMRDTLAWLNRDVAPYPGRTLRLIAAPEFGSSGFALPQVMLISHRRGFRAHRAPGAGFDQAYRRAVHETAHQWFGHLIGYGMLEERAFLIESLAKYAELVMVERRHGTRAMLALVAWEADRYAGARLAPAEATTPLIDAEDTEDMYSRATLAFACLRAKVGDATIVAALRESVAITRQTGRPGRSLDFVESLKREGATSENATIDRLLNSSLPIELALARSGCTGASGT